jgi:hypothetical protein
MLRRLPLPLLVIAAVLVCVQHPAQAALLALSGSVFGVSKTGGGGVLDEFNLSGSATLTDGAAAGFDAGNGQVGSGSVSPAILDYGQFKTQVSVNAESSQLGYFMDMQAFVTGTVNDTFTIMPANASLIGTVATMTFGVQVSGGLSASDTSTVAHADDFSNVGWTLFAGVLSDAGGGNGSFSGTQGSVTGYTGDPLNVVLSTTADVILGQPATLQLQYQVAGHARADTQGFAQLLQATALADLSHTLGWTGISQVAVGEVPIQFTVTSDSGTNWAQSQIAALPPDGTVPEPAALWLFGIAFAGLLAPKRRARATEIH